MYKILVTSRTFASTTQEPVKVLQEIGCEIIRSPIVGTHSAEQLLPLVEGIDGMIVGLDRINEAVLEKAAQLKAISIHATGYDGVALSLAAQKGIMVTNAPGSNSNAVAELALGLLLTLVRKIPAANISTKAGKWESFSGVEIYGKNIGIIGFGRIGRLVAERLKGFSANIMAVDTFRDEAAASALGVSYCELEDMLKAADFVILCAPLTEESRDMINHKEISIMKTGTYIINVGRGATVNEAALYEALKDGKLAGAALDAFELEPPSADSPLLTLENVIATPHMAAFTTEAITRMSTVAANNLRDMLTGVIPASLVNKDIFSAIRR